MHLKTKSALLLVFTAIALSAVAGAEGRDRGRRFLGLWEGVDVNDGSKRTISVTDRNRDGVLEVASRDTFWTLCNGDRGLEIATGRVRHDGVLETQGFVTCFEDGTELPVVQTYAFSRREGTLLATPIGTGLTPVTLHRIGK